MKYGRRKSSGSQPPGTIPRTALIILCRKSIFVEYNQLNHNMSGSDIFGQRPQKVILQIVRNRTRRVDCFSFCSGAREKKESFARFLISDLARVLYLKQRASEGYCHCFRRGMTANRAAWRGRGEALRSGSFESPTEKVSGTRRCALRGRHHISEVST